MTFNVRYGDAQDGPNSWPQRRPAAIEAIRRFGPHVLAVQEAITFQNREILEAFPMFGSVGVGRDDGIAEGEHATLFFDMDRLALEGSGTFWFSPQPDRPGSKHPECFHPRICTWAQFTEGFSLYNLHLDNVSSASRISAVDQLLSRIKPNEPSIVTGDFNAGEDDPCIEAIRQGGYADSFRQVHPDELAVGTYHGFQATPEPDKIDYIWIDSDWSSVSADIVRDQYEGHWPSDHFPVTAVLRCPKLSKF